MYIYIYIYSSSNLYYSIFMLVFCGVVVSFMFDPSEASIICVRTWRMPSISIFLPKRLLREFVPGSEPSINHQSHKAAVLWDVPPAEAQPFPPGSFGHSKTWSNPNFIQHTWVVQCKGHYIRPNRMTYDVWENTVLAVWHTRKSMINVQ